MALEDRCSPQSASPPHRMPNTPSQESRNSTATDKEMAHIAKNFDISTIKAEEDDTMSSADEQPQSAVSFSISNILSDTFGKAMHKPHHHHHRSTGGSGSSLFRPYDIKEHYAMAAAAAARPIPNYPMVPTNLDHPAFLQSRLEEIYNYRKMVDSLGTFNAYPKIHEEIINSHRKFTQKLEDRQNAQSVKSPQLTPPLGNLCKTVSQIGRPTVTTTPAASISPKSDRSSLISPPNASQKNDMDSSDDTKSETSSTTKDENGQLWPAWVFCTRYSDRPSSGPRYRRPKKEKPKDAPPDEKRPRTAFSTEQLARLKREFTENRYLTERRRQQLSSELGLNEAQIKIWFQNKRAKIKKSSGHKNPLALQLMAQGLYNHSTVPLTPEEEELEMRMNGQL